MAATLADLLCWYEKLSGNSQRSVVILNRSKEILKGDVNSHLREIAQKALQRTVPVEMLLEVSASAIRPSQVEYKASQSVGDAPSSNHYLEAGNTVHPLIKDFNIPRRSIARSGSG